MGLTKAGLNSGVVLISSGRNGGFSLCPDKNTSEQENRLTSLRTSFFFFFFFFFFSERLTKW